MILYKQIIQNKEQGAANVMNESFWTKLLLSIVTLGGIAITTLIAAFITAMMGGIQFYTPLVLFAAAGLAVFAILSIWQLFGKRARRMILLSLTGLCLLATAGHEVKKAYLNSFGEIKEQEVDLHQYAPFQDHSKAAVLEEPATFTISESLPNLDGATALYPLYSAFTQAVYPEGRYEPYDKDSPVACMTTPEAYKRLIAGEADIIFAAAPSVAQELEAKHKGLELKLTPIGREAFVFFVNRHNPVQGLTTDQIKSIYSGEITDWSEVGGKNDTIRAFQRPEDSGSQTMLQKIMDDTPIMNPLKEDIASMMGGIIHQTANYRNYKNALGYSFLFYASEMNRSGDIHLLDINGIKPSRESIRSGEYPYAAEFYAVTAGSNNPNIKPFLEWILSPQGQELVEETGYTAIQ